MSKLFASLLLMPVFAAITLFGMLFISFINAVIAFFIWNHLAPLYFVNILQPQFIHLPFFHCWMALYLIGITFGPKTSSVESKK